MHNKFRETININLLFEKEKKKLRVSQSLIFVAIIALVIFFANAYDPSPLQDFCVATDDLNGVFVNGRFCKDPRLSDAKDFFFSGHNIPGNTNNQVGSNVTTVNVDQIPGLSTMGISLVRIDYAPYGQNPPHTQTLCSGQTLRFIQSFWPRLSRLMQVSLKKLKPSLGPRYLDINCYSVYHCNTHLQMQY
ncbi:PREDICTED: germin-like protein subfamily 1 member 20 [Camelina sativa]|uniref:Germin-like protein subfamily 1 member 20 n=1 Tax=Camelina sativa TaxID=90675 RepID=A0ABM0U4U5_CAMSA|nr:PREDICTED: germin-like protein subfamily 1 member 20 [Camelina sativa]